VIARTASSMSGRHLTAPQAERSDLDEQPPESHVGCKEAKVSVVVPSAAPPPVCSGGWSTSCEN
jgi:hypothetical protein